jgi:hypothetical protein
LTDVSKKYRQLNKQNVYSAIDALMKYIDGEAELPPGLGLKNWQGDYWEIRAGIKDRVLFEFTDRISFLFVGMRPTGKIPSGRHVFLPCNTKLQNASDQIHTGNTSILTASF